MKAIIFHNPACGTSRKTLAILQDALGVDVVAMGLLDADGETAAATGLWKFTHAQVVMLNSFQHPSFHEQYSVKRNHGY